MLKIVKLSPSFKVFGLRLSLEIPRKKGEIKTRFRGGESGLSALHHFLSAFCTTDDEHGGLPDMTTKTTTSEDANEFRTILHMIIDLTFPLRTNTNVTAKMLIVWCRKMAMVEGDFNIAISVSGIAFKMGFV